jgi:hypothetical protein
MSKARIEKQTHQILHRYGIGQHVTDEDEVLFLLDLFSQHPDWPKKKGVGVESISITQSAFKTRCFVLHRWDGSTTDISYKKCVSPPSDEQLIRQACRDALHPQIYAFRNAHVVFGVTRCPITNDVLTRENTHIDHYELTFDEMFRLWLPQWDMEDLLAGLAPACDNAYGRRFANNKIIDHFIQFHDGHCKLRAVTRKANLSLLK